MNGVKQFLKPFGQHVIKPCQHVIRRNLSLESNYTRINDQTIHYVRAGQGPEPVLLLPGALGSATSDFTPQLEGLDRDKFTLIGWDPPGYGGSRPPARNFHNFFAADARCAHTLMHQLGFDGGFSAVGWSDGGITALVLAGRYPAAVRKLVVFGSNAYISQADIDMIDKVADVSAWSDRMKKPMFEMYGDGFPALWTDWCNAYREIYRRDGGDICCGDLKAIQAPTLVIHGAKDVMVAEEHVEHLTSNIKNAKSYIFPEGKHNLHFKYQKEFNKMVEEFILAA